MKLLADVTLRSTLARVRGQAFHFTDAGHGTPVLALHGLSASSHVFAGLSSRVPGVRIVAPDLPCSGRSGRYQSLSPRRLATDFAQLIEELKLAPAIVVAHSYGGLVASELIANHPKLIRSAVFIATPVLGMPALNRLVRLGIAERMWSLLERWKPTPSAIRAYMRFMWGEPAEVTPELVQRYVEATGGEGFHGATLEALRELGGYHLPMEQLRKAGVPVSIVWGERDRLVPLTYGEHVATSLGAPLTVLPAVGHFVPEERPGAIAKALGALLPGRTVKPRRTTRARAR